MDWTPLKALVGGSNSNFGLIVLALVILWSDVFGANEHLVSVENRLGNVEKEIVELRVETKTEIDGLKEDVRRIERKLDDFIAPWAAGP